jgi:cysteine dioxygenase
MQTLNELIQSIDFEIREKRIDNALDLLDSFDNYNGEDWEAHCLPQKNEFQYAVLHQDKNFKLILIYWSESDKSKKHGHMKGGGLMRVLSGKIRETRFHPDNTEVAIGTFVYSKGDLSYIHDALAFHTVENQEETPAVSLRLYCTGTNSTFGTLGALEPKVNI